MIQITKVCFFLILLVYCMWASKSLWTFDDERSVLTHDATIDKTGQRELGESFTVVLKAFTWK